MANGQNRVSMARRFRKTANFPERRAWQGHSRLSTMGYTVRRQHRIGGLVFDFAIARTK